MLDAATTTEQQQQLVRKKKTLCCLLVLHKVNSGAGCCKFHSITVWLLSYPLGPVIPTMPTLLSKKQETHAVAATYTYPQKTRRITSAASIESTCLPAATHPPPLTAANVCIHDKFYRIGIAQHIPHSHILSAAMSQTSKHTKPSHTPRRAR